MASRELETVTEPPDIATSLNPLMPSSAALTVTTIGEPDGLVSSTPFRISFTSWEPALTITCPVREPARR